MDDENPRYNEAINAVEAVMAEHPGCDWTAATQSVAMRLGINELELIEDLSDYFEGDPMGDMRGRNE